LIELTKNGDVYGISPVISTGSFGLAAPGSIGIAGRRVAVEVGVGSRVAVGEVDSPEKTLQAIETAKTKDANINIRL